MMFVANDNNLGQFTAAKLEEIETVGSTLSSDVIVQFDTRGPSLIRRFRFSKRRRFRLRKLQRETNTGDKRTLIKFLNLTLEDFHPRRPMLVISNHGSGVEIAGDEFTRRPIFHNAAGSPQAPAQPVDTGKPPDLGSADALDNIELKAALTAVTRKHGPLDLLVFDACLMSTLEIAYQLRRNTRFMVASQSNIPVPGCRFAPTLEFMRDDTLPTGEIARALVKHNVPDLVFDEYSSMAALNLDHADEVAQAVSTLAEALMNAPADQADAITLAHLSALAFLDSETVDLFDFCQRLEELVEDDDVIDAAADVQEAIDAFVIEVNPQGAVVEGARGVSITFPRRNFISDAYRQLDFARETSWVEFLESYLPQRFPSIADEPAEL